MKIIGSFPNTRLRRLRKHKWIRNIVSENKDNDFSKNENYNSVNFKEASNESIKAIALIRAYRIRGHLLASLDPLGLQVRKEHPELKPTTYGFNDQSKKRKIFLDGTLGLESADIDTLINRAKDIYCGNIGYEYMHMSDPVERSWIRERIEGK